MLGKVDFLNEIKLYVPENFSFKCQDCGDCCRHEPGFVLILDKEIRRISKFLKIPSTQFLQDYCYPFGQIEISIDGKIDKTKFKQIYSLKEKDNFDCIFWEKKNEKNSCGCNIYNVRPLQCRSYPFWLSSFNDKESFNQNIKRCRGFMTDGGQIFNKKTIYKKVYRDLVLRKEHYRLLLNDYIYSYIYEE